MHQVDGTQQKREIAHQHTAQQEPEQPTLPPVQRQAEPVDQQAPGRLRYASSGPGWGSWIASKLLEVRASIKLEEIPYAYGPSGAKGIGELPMDGPAPAILNAIESATGAAVNQIPLLPEMLMELVHG